MGRTVVIDFSMFRLRDIALLTQTLVPDLAEGVNGGKYRFT